MHAQVYAADVCRKTPASGGSLVYGAGAVCHPADSLSQDCAPAWERERLESPRAITRLQDFKAKQIGWAVVTMSYRTFWQSTCLVQAIAVQLMLNRRGIPGTLYLGAVKDKENKLHAHAWVRCGKSILTGAEGHQRFSVISTFAQPQGHQSSSTISGGR